MAIGINFVTFLVARTVAQERGVSAAEATRLGFVGSIFKPPVLGIVVAAAIANNEAQSSTVTATGASALAAAAGAAGSLPAAGAGAITPGAPTAAAHAAPTVVGLAASLGMPSFHGMDKAQAEALAKALGLNLQLEGAHGTGKVEWQEPAIGKPLPADSNVRLRFAKRDAI